ncbi:MAG: OmpA family protein [Bacteroidales bacterium]|nr:OmpA family protein [Bacteroidales bacterium]
MLTLFLQYTPSFSQFYFLDEPTDKLEISFLKNKIETQAEKSFFNILKINNNSDQKILFNVNFNIPQGWSLMTESSKQITLAPNDSIFIPVRAATARDVKGEIGYSIVASLTDNNEKAITNAYTYVNVPKKTDIRFNPINRIIYFDPKTGTSKFSFNIQNKGNIDELLYFDFSSSYAIEIPGESKNQYTIDIVVPYQTDTVIEFKVNLKDIENIDKRNVYRINYKVSNQDTSFQSAIWCKDLKSKYVNYIPDINKPLIIELMAQNLFSEFESVYTGLLQGNILFRNNRNIYYHFRNYRFPDPNGLLQNSRYFAGYTDKNFKIHLGDVLSSYELNTYGKGIELGYNKNRHQIIGLVTKNPIRPINSYAGKYNFPIGNNNHIGLGFANSDNQEKKTYSKLGYFQARTKILKHHNFSALFGLSNESHKLYTPYNAKGYGLKFTYNGSINKIKFSSKTNYGSPRYAGVFNGRLDTKTTVNYPLNNKDNIMFNYSKYNFGPAVYINDVIQTRRSTNYERIELSYSSAISPRINIFFSPTYNFESSNSFNSISPDDIFSTQSAIFQAGIRLRSINSQNTLRPSLRVGHTRITDYTKTINEEYFNIPKIPPILNARFSLNYASRNWGVFMNYFYGPNSINQQFSYFYNNYFSKDYDNLPKSVRILPYAELFIYKNILKLTSRLSYINDITNKSTRINFSNELYTYLGSGWELKFSSNIINSKDIDKSTNTEFKYNSAYFEFGIKKEFDFNQPRLKYYDLEVIFYKDLNGNRIKDENEPGIKNILVEITRDEEIDMFAENRYDYSGEFVYSELLSDQMGRIEYKNIPEGNYFVKFTPLGESVGKFSPDDTNPMFMMNQNKTVYIPFLERNRIFGKVVLNRSKLSNLGKIDISNIKVTATDTEGRQYSSLTDKDGKFVIYVPNIDEYNVTINNIFYENFELQQSNFEVQLNGYKQFEISYIFNEKRRRIRFKTTYDYDQNLDIPGIEIVRRTNLQGVIKDATTQKPIRAKISVVDKDEKEITSVYSNTKEGQYSLSFMAGDDYNIFVTAVDYWFYAEKLYSKQIVTFQNINKDILLKAITIGAIIPLNHLNFGVGDTELSPEAVSELERLLKVLKKNHGVRIAVHGHADDQEILETKDDLAMERANIVAKYLIANGYNRVKYSGHANTKPIATNDTEDGRKLNRRAEIVVIDK